MFGENFSQTGFVDYILLNLLTVIVVFILVEFWLRELDLGNLTIIIFWITFFINIFRQKSSDVNAFVDNVKNEDKPIPRVKRMRKFSRRPSDQLEEGEYSSETDYEGADEDSKSNADAEPLPDSNIEN